MNWKPPYHWEATQFTSPYQLKMELEQSITPLMIASCFNLHEAGKYITSTLYPKEIHLNYCSHLGTALFFAVENKSIEMVC